MKKLLFFVLFLAFISPAFGHAANTTIDFEGTISIVPDGSSDWTWSADLSGAPNTGINVKSIQFIPSAATDRLIIHNGGLDAVNVFDSGPAEGTTPIIKYYPPNKRIKVVMDATDCTLDTPASVRIYIEYE